MTTARRFELPAAGVVLHRTTDSGCKYLLRLPVVPQSGAVPLVTVHGISRNAHEHATRLSDIAERAGALLVAPIFGRERRGYQRLRDAERQIATDLDLIEALRLAAAETGADTSKVNLLGFSGGGQFAHRFALIHPARIARLATVAAGWYTFPDTATAYPFGVAPATDTPLEPDIGGLLRIPTLVAVGTRDTERDRSLRKGRRIDRIQGTDRVERARRWVDSMRRTARLTGAPPAVMLEMLPRTGHSFAEAMGRGGLESLALEFFYGRLRGRRTAHR